MGCHSAKELCFGGLTRLLLGLASKVHELTLSLFLLSDSYDSTDPDALGSLSVLLKAFWTRGSDVPLIVLACKALAPDQGRNATDPTEAAKVCNIYGAGIVTLDGGLEDPSRKTKESFKYIIRQIMENRGELLSFENLLSQPELIPVCHS